MTDKRKVFQRVLSFVLSAVMLLSFLPLPSVTLRASAEEGLTRYADPSTMDNWHSYFYRSANDFDTANAGGIWNDKTVLTSADELEAMGITGIADPSERGFLAVLSAIGSNMTVSGEAAVATDTVLVLDISGSMGQDAVEAMVEATNVSIHTLMDENPNNRVAVVFYSSTATTFLPLDHYTTGSDGIYLGTRTTRDYTYITLNDNVLNSSSRHPNVSDKQVVGGTYIARGLYQALEIFQDADIDQTNTPRIPVIMLMTDGVPTYADTDFTNPPADGSNSSDLGTGNNRGTGKEVIFATELTASYVKQTVTAKYGESHKCLFYTLGMGLSSVNNDYKECVLNPTVANTEAVNALWTTWETTASGTSFEIGTGYIRSNRGDISITAEITKIDSPALSTKYVDRYFSAATSDELVETFESVLADIALHTIYYPTLVEGIDSNHSGYISFVDKMGRYMDVIAIRGLIIDNQLYTGSYMAHAFNEGELGTVQNPTDLGDNLIWSIKERAGVDADTARSLVNSAYNAGQLYYNSETDFSNYIGWYSDADNNFLGFYAEGTTVPTGAVYTNKSYLFLGELDPTTQLRDSQMMYATIRIREEIATGEDEVDFAIPASLVPTVTYNVELDVNGNIENITTNATTVSPIRLVYETELDSRINKWTAGEVVADSYKYYLSEFGNSYTMNEDGSINFYNNKWSFDRLEGYGTLNPYAYYRPSYENNRHYYQDDAIFYVADGNGYTVYEGAKPVAGDGRTYYHGATVYAKTGANSFEKNTVFEPIKNDIYYAAEQNGDGNWYIPAKYIRFGYAEYSEIKSVNTTDTSVYAVSPYADYTADQAQAGMDGHDSIVGATLGNNGKIILDAQTGIRITKQVEDGVNSGDKAFSFIVTNENLKSTTCQAYKLDADGNGSDTTVSFSSSGVATVFLKAGESIYIGDMATGDIVTVKEHFDADYMVTSLTVDGTADSDMVAEVSLTTADIAHAVFTNNTRPKGSVTVSKRITHPYGSNYTIPADKDFPITLTFTMDGAPLANYPLSGGDMTDVNGQLTFNLTHNSSKLIEGIPVGTVVQVTESASQGFTPTYHETSGIENDGIVTISTTTSTVAIVNDYLPDPPATSGESIQVSGIKRFDQEGHARLWAVGDSFTFMLQEYKNGWVTIEHENAIKTITIEEGDGYVGTTKDYPFDFTNVFKDIVYTAPGTYVYRVAEQGGAIPGVSYDNTSHRFQVTVSDDDMSGTLTITKVESLAEPVTVSGSYDVTATFVNDYNPSSVVVNFQLQKTVQNPSGSPLATLEGFSYLLSQVNDFSDTVDWSKATNMGTTSSTGVIRFPVTIDTAGTYYYKVKEFIPQEIPAGWIYTEIIHDVIVEVTDNYGEAGLVARAYLATATNIDESTSTVILPFENIYDPDGDEIILVDHEPTDLNPDFVRKNLTGRDMAAGEFEFVIYDETNQKEYIGTNEAGTAGSFVSVNFLENLVFDTVGEFNYSVYERKTDKAGVTYDDQIYNFTVVVTDSGEGYLEAVLTVNDGVDDHNVVNFTNSYQAEPVPYSLTGSKEFSGKNLTANAFTFYIQPCTENGNPIPGTEPTPVYNAEDGTITFPEVTYTSTGEYHYLIWENIPTADKMGITYDATRYVATVRVDDDTANGKLVASASYQKLLPGDSTLSSADDGIRFTNSYKASSVSVSFNGSKTMVGMDLTASYDFSLYQSNEQWEYGEPLDTRRNGAPNEDNTGFFSFAPQTFDATGTYHFLAVENIPDEKQAGVAYDTTEYRITVTVTDNGRGQLVASTAIRTADNVPADMLEFVNTYAPITGTSITFNGTKTLTTGEGTDVDFSNFDFTFELYNAQVAEGVFTPVGEPIATADADKTTHQFSLVTKYEPEDLGKTFHYVIVEKDNNHGGVTYSTVAYHITVEVLDNFKDGELETNVIITDSNGNEANKDNIDFINNYAIVNTTSFDISGNKTLNGRDIQTEEFIFDLYPANENGTTTGNAIKSVYCDTEGLFSFTDIPLTSAGTHYFVVSENTSSNIPGVTYDTTEYLITVVVQDNKYGTLTVDSITCHRIEKDAENVKVDAPAFTNQYSASASAPLTLSVNKTLTGRNMDAGEFVFEIYDEDNQTPYATGTNRVAVGSNPAVIDFDKSFVFTRAGTYRFSVYELDPQAPSVTKDPNKYYFNIIVTDDTEQGTLVATFEGLGSASQPISFTNSYKAEPVPYTITGIKNLEGQEITQGRFSFAIQPCDENGNPSSTQQAKAVANGEQGAIAFPEYTYDQIGTYHYLVWEVIPEGEKYGITYDETRYIATVTVTDNYDTGKLEADISYQIQLPGETTWTNIDSGIVFGNKYHASSTFAVIDGTKTVTGMDLVANAYSFTLYASDESWTLGDALCDPVGNSAPDGNNVGTFAFPRQSYDTVGTHYYIVKENIPDEKAGGITYDETVYYITVEVTDNDKGLLVPTTTIAIEKDGNKVPVEEIAFVNKYAVNIGAFVTVAGEKSLDTGDGTDVSFGDFDFTFVLYEAQVTDGVFTPMKELDSVNANKENHTFSFTMNYLPEDLGKTFYYVVAEENVGTGGVTYSTAEYYITVEVLDERKDGELETNVIITDKDGAEIKPDHINFTNNYAIKENAKFSIAGEKKLSGRSIKQNEFKFDLYASNGTDKVGSLPVADVYCNTDGKFTISDIELNKAGVHYFILEENDSQQLKKPGVSYDQTQYLITVTVVDNKDGTLSALEPVYANLKNPDKAVDTLLFQNKYVASPSAPLYLSGTKFLSGRELADGEFRFLLQATDSQFKPADSEPIAAVNAANGLFTFSGLTYYSAGTYYYVITEDDTLDISRVTFDDIIYYITVNVWDDTNNGKLVAEYTVKTAPDGEPITGPIQFNNTFTPRPDDIPVTLDIIKTVVNKGLATITPEGFQFLLELEGLEEGITVTSDENGKASFTLTFTEDDIDNTYTFRLTELNGGEKNVTYSTAEYIIVISISLGQNNKLVASITQDTVPVEAVVVEFINEYDYTPPAGPPTGDNSNLYLPYALLTLSAGAILTLCISGKKKEEQEDIQ